MEEAALQAQEIPFPKKEQASTKVYKEFDVEDSLEETEEEIVMMDGLNHALEEEMRKDEDIVVFGEDVAKNKGGVFRITKN